ncbi:HEAT repeat domain-containing protein [bacterium]|nr:HEAT repeat domain-containing protein [bacterium]
MIILVLISIITAAPDTFWNVERDYLLQGLELMNLSAKDLEYDKQWIPDSFRLKAVSNLMDKPLYVPDYVIGAGERVKGCISPSEYFSMTSEEITGRTASPESPKSKDVEQKIKEIFALTDKHLQKAFAGLSSAERDSLLYTAPALWSDEADSLQKGYAGALEMEFGVPRDTGYGLKLVNLLRLSKKVDVYELNVAGATLAEGVEGLIPLAERLLEQENPPDTQVDGVEGIVYAVYDLGNGQKAVIGGPWRNVYTANFAVIVDLGGNDIYEGRVAGAVGGLGSPVSFVLDLSGDDVYRNGSKLVNQGAALFGSALLWDIEGDDSYNAFHISQGAAIFATGMLIDEEGVDSYRAGYFTQAAGNFGTGIMIERHGDDQYRSYSWAQGLGGPLGYGLLADEEGDDIYYAGGQYLHMPLDPDQYRSFAQGFGFGWRDVSSGGIGFLYDKNGNDKYIGEVYAQATSYWFALGMMLDEQGNDLYTAAQYSQGAGIHLSVGGLFDMEGDDHYFSRFGPSQGEGHDLAVGWLMDKDGDDVYYASGGQGIGLTNSVGIFVDTRGNDDYASREALSEGGANWSRGTGGIGLFIDLQGDDRYAEKDKGSNNDVWPSGSMAIGMDLEAVEPKKEEWEDTTAAFPELDTMKTDSAKIARLFHYASLWEVRADIGKVRTARKMLKEQFGASAVYYIFNYEFSTYDGLVQRAVELYFSEFKDTAGYYLFKGLHSTNDTIVRNSIYLLGQLKIDGAGDTLLKMLENKSMDSLAGSLIAALGSLKEKKAVSLISKYANHNKERMRLRAVSALAEIKDTASLATLMPRIFDESFSVKLAAMSAVASLGKPAIENLTAEIRKSQTDIRRAILIRTIRNTYRQLADSEKTSEIKKNIANLAKPYLDSSWPALREQTKKLLDEVDGRAVLGPADLFLMPEDMKEKF